MKNIISKLVALTMVLASVPAYPDAVIFSGNDVKALKSNLDLNGQAKVMSGTVDPTSVATSAPVGSIYLNTSNGNTYRKLDAGSSTNWSVVGSAGSAGINYVSNTGIEATITGISAYADAAGVSPVDGTGGSPASTIARTTTGGEVLRGVASAEWTKSAANRQGEGFSTDIKVDPQDSTGGSKAIIIQFDYLITGTYVDDDMQMFVYDKDGATVLGVVSGASGEAGKIKNCATTPCKFMGVFYTVAGNDDYRIIWHTASTSTSAYNVYVDNIRAGPDNVVPGAIINDLGTEAWTVVNATATSSVRLTRIGNRVYADGTVSFTGAASGLIGLTIPSAYAPSTSDYSQLGTSNIITGWSKFVDTGTANYDGTSQLTSTTNLSFVAENSSATYVQTTATSSTVPHTWANTDKITFQASWIVSGWAATAALSTTEAMLTSARVLASRSTSQQNFSTGATTTIIFDTEDHDNLSGYNPSTGEFTAPKTGNYFVEALWYSATQSALADNERLILYAYVNGSIRRVLAENGSGSNTQVAINGSGIVQLNKGDVLTIRLFQDSASTLSTIATANNTNLSIHQIPDLSVFSVFGQTEYFESKSSSSITWPFSASTYGDFTSLTLQPGEYDLTGIVEFSNNGAVSANFAIVGISTTSGNSGSGLATGDSRAMFWNVGTSGLFQTFNVPNYRVVVTSPTTYYLKGYYGGTITNLKQEGYKLSARRVK